MDVVRLMPLIGLALWMIPLFWPVPSQAPGPESAAAMSTSVALQYIFGVWGAVVGLAWRLGRATRRAGDPATSDGAD